MFFTSVILHKKKEENSEKFGKRRKRKKKDKKDKTIFSVSVQSPSFLSKSLKSGLCVMIDVKHEYLLC
jgi:hypothetical protein